MREIVALCLNQDSTTEDNLDLTTFAFLYGTLPSAPGVFVYANAYGLDIDLVIIEYPEYSANEIFWQVLIFLK